MLNPDSPLRVAFVAPFGLRAKGTARARALPLARAVARRGHQVALFVPPYDSPEDSGLCWHDGDVPVCNVPLPPGPATALWYLRLAARLWSAVRAFRPSVVHVFKPKGPSGLVATGWWARGAGLVVDSDDWEGRGGWNDDPRAGYSWLQRRVFAWQERHGLSHAGAWTVTSTCLAGRAAGFGADPTRVFLLPNGLSDPRYADIPAGGSRKPSVLLYTRFAGVRLDEVVAAWRKVVERAPGATLTVVGRGLAGEEKRLAEAAPGVQVHGWLDPAEMPACFAAQALAIVPWVDTPPNRARHSAKVLELMASGLPVVATAVGELPATLDDAGVLVPPGDATALASAVVGLLHDPARRNRLGTAARARVLSHYTWDHLAGQALAAYATALLPQASDDV